MKTPKNMKRLRFNKVSEKGENRVMTLMARLFGIEMTKTENKRSARVIKKGRIFWNTFYVYSEVKEDRWPNEV